MVVIGLSHVKGCTVSIVFGPGVEVINLLWKVLFSLMMYYTLCK